jgi:hypothetical protein
VIRCDDPSDNYDNEDHVKRRVTLSCETAVALLTTVMRPNDAPVGLLNGGVLALMTFTRLPLFYWHQHGIITKRLCVLHHFGTRSDSRYDLLTDWQVMMRYQQPSGTLASMSYCPCRLPSPLSPYSHRTRTAHAAFIFSASAVWRGLYR